QAPAGWQHANAARLSLDRGSRALPAVLAGRLVRSIEATAVALAGKPAMGRELSGSVLGSGGAGFDLRKSRELCRSGPGAGFRWHLSRSRRRVFSVAKTAPFRAAGHG